MCFKTRKSDFRPKIRGSVPASSTLKQFLIFKKLTRNTKHGDLSQTADQISRSRGQFCETHNNSRCNSPLTLKKSNAFFFQCNENSYSQGWTETSQFLFLSYIGKSCLIKYQINDLPFHEFSPRGSLHPGSSHRQFSCFD